MSRKRWRDYGGGLAQEELIESRSGLFPTRVVVAAK